MVNQIASTTPLNESMFINGSNAQAAVQSEAAPSILNNIYQLQSPALTLATPDTAQTMRHPRYSQIPLVEVEPVPIEEEDTSHLPPKEKQGCLYSMARVAIDALTHLDNISFEVSGLNRLNQHRGPAVLAVNHHSLTDGLMLLSQLKGEKVHFVIKEELFKGPLKGFLNALGMVPMVRSGGQNSQDALAKVKELLSEGKTVCMFPEGTLSRDGALHKGKTGIARLLIETGADYFPVGIQGPQFRDKLSQLTPITNKTVNISIGNAMKFDTLLQRSQPAGCTHDDLKQGISTRSQDSKKALDEMVKVIMSDIQFTINGDKDPGDDGFVRYVDDYLTIPKDARKSMNIT